MNFGWKLKPAILHGALPRRGDKAPLFGVARAEGRRVELGSTKGDGGLRYSL